MTEADEVAANINADLLTIYTLDDALKHVPPADEVGYQVRDDMAEALVNRALLHRRNLQNLFTLVDNGAKAMVLNLDARDRKTCMANIAWQRRGGFTEPMHVCRHIGNSRFADIETGKEFTPERSPYTETAWTDFLARLEG